MPIDNEIYNREANRWWADDSPMATLRSMLNPGRFGYFRKLIEKDLVIDPKGLRVLDIGCGGGFLAEEFARLGCRVTGIDPAADLLETARGHAQATGLEIKYLHGSGESLPFDEAAFDLVYCCDVLEHVSDLNQVIAETARVLKPGGYYFYDTINRTTQSRLVMIKLLQDWRATRLLPPDVHVWDMFIKPEELHETMRHHGLENGETVGLTPAAGPMKALSSFLQFRLGMLNYAQLGDRIRSRASADTRVSYMGWARRRGPGTGWEVGGSS